MKILSILVDLTDAEPHQLEENARARRNSEGHCPSNPIPARTCNHEVTTPLKGPSEVAFHHHRNFERSPSAAASRA